MSNSIHHRAPATPFAAPSVGATEKPSSSAAETQTSIFQRPSPSALVKPVFVLPAEHTLSKITAKKTAKSEDFSSPEASESQATELSAESTAQAVKGTHSGQQGNSDGSSDDRDDTLFVYQTKLSELNQLCAPGMSVADGVKAKALAMQVVLCANVATLGRKKTTRELSEVIGLMVQKLAQGGASLPTDTENLLDLLKTQSAHLPLFLRSRLEDKDSIRGHLLPLLLLALRRQTPAVVTPNVFMYGVVA